MTTVTKLTQAGLSNYINAVKRECVRLDMAAAFARQPKALLTAITDHPQQTLDQYTAKYGIQMDAADELPKLTYLVIKSRQGHDLSTLLADMDDSSARLLTKLNADFHAELRHSDSLSRQHTVLFQSATLPLETVAEGLSAGQHKKK